MAISIEGLIERVKQHEMLYNTSHPEYKNLRAKYKLWDEIAKDMQLEDMGGDEVKKRWKGLKDCYLKYLRAQRAHTAEQAKTIGRYRVWRWARHMEIFKPYLNLSLLESSDLVDEEILQSNGRPSTKTFSAQLKRRRTNPTASQSCSMDKIISFMREQQNTMKQFSDEVDLVFQGYAASVKKLSPQRQTMIKFKVAQLIMEAEIEQQEELESQRRRGSISFESFLDIKEDVKPQIVNSD